MVPSGSAESSTTEPSSADGATTMLETKVQIRSSKTHLDICSARMSSLKLRVALQLLLLQSDWPAQVQLVSFFQDLAWLDISAADSSRQWIGPCSAPVSGLVVSLARILASRRLVTL